jgi:hypothetical protein
MTPFVALVFAVILLVYWRAALALIAVMVIALIILGIFSVLQPGHAFTVALASPAVSAAHVAVTSTSTVIG